MVCKMLQGWYQHDSNMIKTKQCVSNVLAILSIAHESSPEFHAPITDKGQGKRPLV